ncbi:MAG: hypothetical protein QXP84_08075 [Candidatus Korarchaeum sp.]
MSVSERQLLDRLKELFEGSNYSHLRKVFAKVNLSTKEYGEIWSDWWEDEPPPREEVDLILVFSDSEVSLIGVEVEHFRGKRSPYRGLEQVLSFGLFGFDSLVLRHIFDPELENRSVERYVKAAGELIEKFKLPVVYIATKFSEDKFEFFFPFPSSYQYEINSFLEFLLNYCKKKRNPLSDDDEVKRRRSVLKLILRIPG